MNSKLTIFAFSMAATLLFAGCKGGGGGVSAIFGSDSTVGSVLGSGSGDSSNGGGIFTAALPSGGDSGSSVLGGGGDAVGGSHSPEPATIALLGSGLFAYAFLRRRKQK